MKPTNTSSSVILKLLVLLGYVTLFFFVIPNLWNLVWFSVGVVLGAAFLLADERYFQALYQEKGSTVFLVSRSPLFVLSLLPLTIFVLTSSGSHWAYGVVGGLGLWLLLEATELRSDPATFDKRFLPTIKGEISRQNIQLVLLFGWLFFALVHLLALL
jgi:hypothetical protein